MSRAFPEEFRRDVVAVASRREAPQKQNAEDFDISHATLSNWWRQADVEDGDKPGVTREQAQEVRKLRRRNRLLVAKRTRCCAARQRICRRRTSSWVATQNDLPARPRVGRRWRVCHGDVPGFEDRTSTVLSVACGARDGAAMGPGAPHECAL